MRFGFAPIRGSNPRASAPDQPLRQTGAVAGFMSVIIMALIWHSGGTAVNDLASTGTHAVIADAPLGPQRQGLGDVQAQARDPLVRVAVDSATAASRAGSESRCGGFRGRRIIAAVRLTSLSGSGVLSFDRFSLPVRERLTIVVGPNGAGKSNPARLLTICQRAVEAADGGRGDVGHMLAAFQAAGHAGSESHQIEARAGLKLTNPDERALVVEFVRAMALGAITARRAGNCPLRFADA
jgi:hypothetical protein